ncbi:MAG: kelch repeat-containing protein [Acidobacteriota bacterium]
MAFPALARNLDSSEELQPATRSAAGRTDTGVSTQDPRPTPPTPVQVPGAGRWSRELREFRAFLPGTSGGIHEVQCGSVRVVLRPLATLAAGAEIDGGLVAYRSAYPGTDSLHVVHRDRTEELLYLRDRVAPTRFTYEIVEMAGVADVVVDGGKVRFADARGEGLEIARPWVLDGGGNRSELAARWSLQRDARGPRALNLELDSTGLTYPLVIDPSWNPTGSMTTPRARHTATLLQSGEVLVTGGSQNGPSASCELYHPASGTWSVTGTMSHPRDVHTATLLQTGQVLVAGGAGKTSEIYDPSLGMWSDGGTMTAVRDSHAAAILPGGGVLLSGGWDTFGFLATAEIFDPATRVWKPTRSMIEARATHTATVLPGGEVLVAGGETYSASTETYDPATATWSPSGSMRDGRAYHTATLLPDGRVLVAGGGGVISIAGMEVFDPATRTWTATTDMLSPRAYLTATLLPSGSVLLAGGVDMDRNEDYRYDVLETAELYDPATGQTSVTTSMTIGRHLHTATLLQDGTVLVAGGYCPLSASPTSEVFDLAGCAPIGLAPPTLPSTVVGTPYTRTIQASGGTAPYAFSTPPGSLPPGLSLAPSGALAGAPTAAGSFSFVITATDAQGCRALRPYTIAIAPASCPFSIAPSSLPDGWVNKPYGQTLSASGGAWPYAFAVTSGALPPGATLSPAGVLSGTPSASATFGFTVTVRDAAGCSTTSSFVVTIAPSWTATGSIAHPRVGHTATLLTDGRVLLAGGRDGQGYVATTELYDPKSGAWSTSAPLLPGRSDHTATLLGSGKVLVAGGFWDGGPIAAALLYDPTLGSWSPTGRMAFKRWQHSATLLPNGKVLVAGGLAAATAELYDPATGTWAPTGALPYEVRGHTATLLRSGDVLLAGGYAAGYYPSASALIYDSTAGAWTATGTMSTPRTAFTATLLPDGRVLAAGGDGFDASVAITETYDPATGVWNPTAPMLGARSGHTATRLQDGRVLVAGRSAAIVTGEPLTTEIYDPYRDRWSPAASLQKPRSAHTATLLASGLVLIAGGYDGGDVAELFDPRAGDDVIVGQGLGQPNPNRVRVLTASCEPTPVDFFAYGAGQWGVNLAGGNAAGGVRDQIFTAPGPGPACGPQVRAFQSTGAPLAKMNYFAYGSARYGANVVTAELDGDAYDDIVTGAGPGAVFGPHVRGWSYDNVAIAPLSRVNFFAYGTPRFGANVGSGDVEGDGYAEILSAPGPGAAFGPQVRGWNYDNGALARIAKINFDAFTGLGFGANVAGGDVDGDRFAEIACAPGPGAGAPFAPRFRGFDYDGNAISAIPGFDVTVSTATSYGGRASIGNVTGGAASELLAGQGRDPSADSTVMPYLFQSGQLAPLAAFIPFPSSGYGVNPGSATLGF